MSDITSLQRILSLLLAAAEADPTKLKPAVISAVALMLETIDRLAHHVADIDAALDSVTDVPVRRPF